MWPPWPPPQGIALTPTQAERLHRHTAGHPLYVRTLLTELSPAQLRVADGDLPAPSSLTSAVTAGLSEVREPARRLAAAMAVVNQRAGLVEIGRVAGVDAPIAPFEELLGTGFVHWEPEQPGTPVAFVHPLYRQAIYRDLPPRTRRDLHRAAVGISGPAAALAHRVAAADGTDDALADELERSAAPSRRGRRVGHLGRARSLVGVVAQQRPHAGRGAPPGGGPGLCRFRPNRAGHRAARPHRGVSGVAAHATSSSD